MGDRIRRWGLRIRIGSLVCLAISSCLLCVSVGHAAHSGFACFAMLGLFCLIVVTDPVRSISSIVAGEAWLVMCATAVLAWSALLAACLVRHLVQRDATRKALVEVFSVVCVVSVVGVFTANARLANHGYMGDVTMHGGSYLWAISLFGLAAAECLDGCFDSGRVSSSDGSVPDRVPPEESSFGRSDSE